MSFHWLCPLLLDLSDQASLGLSGPSQLQTHKKWRNHSWPKPKQCQHRRVFHNTFGEWGNKTKSEMDLWNQIILGCYLVLDTRPRNDLTVKLKSHHTTELELFEPNHDYVTRLIRSLFIAPATDKTRWSAGHQPILYFPVINKTRTKKNVSNTWNVHFR